MVPKDLHFDAPNSTGQAALSGRSASSPAFITDGATQQPVTSTSGLADAASDSTNGESPRGENHTSQEESSESKVILLAEDDDEIRKMIRALLGGAGYAVTEARDGNEALDTFTSNSEKIDLVILDLVMPRVGGKAVLENISKIRPSCPVILTSGCEATAVERELGDRQNTVFLEKPYLPGDLLKEVHGLLTMSAGVD